MQVAQFKKLVETLGTAADTRALRSKLKALRDSIQASARDNSAAVKQLSSAAAAGALTIEVRLQPPFRSLVDSPHEPHCLFRARLWEIPRRNCHAFHTLMFMNLMLRGSSPPPCKLNSPSRLAPI